MARLAEQDGRGVGCTASLEQRAPAHPGPGSVTIAQPAGGTGVGGEDSDP